MSPAHAASLAIVAGLALFCAVGLIFLAANLLIGRFVRPASPSLEKLDVYECGEPSIGSSFVQFDLRFYVVALLFIIFDVEIAFFFPWAVVFGKSIHLADDRLAVVATDAAGQARLSAAATGLYRELGVRDPQLPDRVPASLSASVPSDGSSAQRAEAIIRRGGRQLAWLTLADIGVFFGVLLIGFAYVWRRGDLDWVRATMQERAAGAVEPAAGRPRREREPSLSL